METNPVKTNKRRRFKIISGITFLVLVAGGFFLYNNFNRLLSEALLRSFNSSIVSDVYELKFEKLRLNLFERSIHVFNVSLQPREKPLRTYTYINSSLGLTAERITLMNVEVFTLLKANRLAVETISITKPDIQLKLDGDKYVFMPFKDTTLTSQPAETRKKSISFSLNEFQLIDASCHVVNSVKQRESQIHKFNISLLKLLIDQQPGTDQVAIGSARLSVGEFDGRMKKGGVRHINFRDFNIGLDSLALQMTLDTLVFHYKDFSAGVKALDVQTADSLLHLSLGAFSLSYHDKSIELSEASLKPNISDSAMQARYTYQHTLASGSVSNIKLVHVNFDSLIYGKGLFIDNVMVNKPALSIFKDNTKPVDPQHLPIYFGQQIKTIPLPLSIKEVNVTDITLVNVERKKDSTYARVLLQRGTAKVKNITNRSAGQPLELSADAYLDNKVHFNVHLGFSYTDPQFTLDAKFEKFNLPDLNAIIQAYTPAKINAGTADEISFSGTVFRTYSTGTMKFFYHDLNIDLELRKKAKWRNSVIAFAANSILDSSNPDTDSPPRIVKYRVERDMHKGFINIILKSALMGLKETMIMSKENKKAYKEAKKKYEEENKK